MSRRGVAKNVLSASLAAILASPGCAAFHDTTPASLGGDIGRAVGAATRHLTPTPDPTFVAHSSASPEINELTDTMFMYGAKKKSYFQEIDDVSINTFERDLDHFHSLLDENEKHLYFFLDVFLAQYHRRNNNMKEAKSALENAQKGLEKTLLEKNMSAFELASVEDPVDYADALFAYYNESAWYLVDGIKKNMITDKHQEAIIQARKYNAKSITINNSGEAFLPFGALELELNNLAKHYVGEVPSQ